MIKLSFVIPVYNQEKLLYKCVESIPKRDDIEIIIVDDGSTDNTIGIINELVSVQYPDYVGAIICKTNHGVSHARNLGLEKARGEYVMFVDSDDYLITDKINYIIDKYLPGDWDIVFYDMEFNNKIISRSTKDNRKERWGMFKIIRKSFISNLRFTVGKQYAEDKEFHVKLMKKKPKWICTNLVAYHYNYPRVGSLSYINDYEESFND